MWRKPPAVLGSRFILKHAPICLLAFIIGGSVFAQAIGPPAGMTTDCALDGRNSLLFQTRCAGGER
jgi:hypothetical protein